MDEGETNAMCVCGWVNFGYFSNTFNIYLDFCFYYESQALYTNHVTNYH